MENFESTASFAAASHGGTSSFAAASHGGTSRSPADVVDLPSISNLEPCSETGPMFFFHGMPVTTVRVLGRMLNRIDEEGETRFVIDDGTGCIDARVTLQGVDYPPDLNKVKDGDYVIVNGGLMYSCGNKYIEVYSFRCVTNFNDIPHHFLLSIHAHLDLKKRAEARRDALQTASVDIQVAPPESPPPLMNNGEELFDNVLRVFFQPGLRDLESGATFELIQKKTGAREDELRSVIDAHITLGNMFTTIDENHFKCSMNG